MQNLGLPDAGYGPDNERDHCFTDFRLSGHCMHTLKTDNLIIFALNLTIFVFYLWCVDRTLHFLTLSHDDFEYFSKQSMVVSREVLF